MSARRVVRRCRSPTAWLHTCASIQGRSRMSVRRAAGHSVRPATWCTTCGHIRGIRRMSVRRAARRLRAPATCLITCARIRGRIRMYARRAARRSRSPLTWLRTCARIQERIYACRRHKQTTNDMLLHSMLQPQYMRGGRIWRKCEFNTYPVTSQHSLIYKALFKLCTHHQMAKKLPKRVLSITEEKFPENWYETAALHHAAHEYRIALKLLEKYLNKK